MSDGHRTLDDVQNARLQAALKKLKDIHGTQKAVAAALSRVSDQTVSQQTVSRVEGGGRGGPYLATKVAKLLGVSYEQLVDEGLLEPSIEPGERRVVLDPRYRNLYETVEWARGEYPEEFLDEMLQQGLGSGEDRPKLEWAKWLETMWGPWNRRRRDPGYAEREQAQAKHFTDAQAEDDLRFDQRLRRIEDEPPPSETAARPKFPTKGGKRRAR